MATCYQLDSKGYLVCETDDFGGFLPAGAIYNAPPDFELGSWPRWMGEAWELVENHKGEAGYLNGEPYTIKDYGPYPEGWSATPPEKSPAEKQAEMIASFTNAIQNRLDAFARTRSYDDARSCVAVYLGCSNKTFAAEAAYMQQAIVDTWEWANGYTNSVLRGEEAMPESWAAFESMLDDAVPLVWPVPDTRVTAALEG